MPKAVRAGYCGDDRKRGGAAVIEPERYQDPSEIVGATLGVRFFARLIDGLLLSFVLSLVILPLFFSDTSLTDSVGGFSASTITAAALSALLSIGYYTFLESARGQTIGKMVLGLRTIGPDGGNPTVEEAFKRNLWYALGIIPVVGGLAQLGAAILIAVTVSSSPMNVGWHDDFGGGTKVIRTR
jgi:uncharacterized RDD family membrane protein YckC